MNQLNLILPIFFILCNFAANGENKQHPNIVIIYADDLGYGDVQCYNPKGKIKTPHIDQLAKEGMRFTDGHSSSGVCTPSRYTLLTGRYHWRTRLQRGIVGLWGPPLIKENRLTLADMLKQQNYQTALVGKWHLGWNWPISKKDRPHFKRFNKNKLPEITQGMRDAWKRVFSQEITGGPMDCGFDEYFGTDVPNWPPFCFIEGRKTIGIPSTLLPTNLFKNHQASNQGPALKNWTLEPILPALGNRASNYIKRASSSDKPYFLFMPLTTPHTPLSVNKEWVGKSGLGPYADLVMETDAIVGQVLEAISKSGEAKNTLVIFTSDNGCAHYIGVNKLEEQGHFPSASLRGYKSDGWEGGHRVPFIVRWPEKVKAGTVNKQYIHQADFMATFSSIVGYTLKDNEGEDSFDFSPLLTGSNKAIRPHGVSQSISGMSNLRQGDWKILFHQGSGGWAKGKDKQPAQLYNLKDDVSEQNNLFDQKPEKVQELYKLMTSIVNNGRSTLGKKQENDVAVIWDRSAKKQ